MKKFGFLALALSLSIYSLGCGTKTEETPVTPAPAEGTTEEVVEEVEVTTDPAPADDAAAHTDGDGHTAEEHAAEAPEAPANP